MNIAYYITPHGFGHAVRSFEVIRRILDWQPGVQVHLVSDLPDFLIEQNLPRPIPLRRVRLDVGLVQKDSVRFDLEATLAELQFLRRQHEWLVAREVEFLRSRDIQLVVADVPFLAFYAASRLELPSVGIGNFTWDWIYQGYARRDRRWGSLLQWIADGYRLCGRFLQLPMHGDCSVCPVVDEVPLIARRARRPALETRKVLGCEEGQKAYLIAFGDLELSSEALNRLAAIQSTVFFYKHPLRFDLLNGRALDPFHELSYPDVVAAVDGVVTKPGYGIVADCLAHGTPMVYTDRGAFPEYDVLVAEMERCLRTVHLPSQDLYAGLWETALHDLDAKPRRHVPVPDHGAAVCADVLQRILENRGGHP